MKLISILINPRQLSIIQGIEDQKLFQKKSEILRWIGIHYITNMELGYNSNQISVKEFKTDYKNYPRNRFSKKAVKNVLVCFKATEKYIEYVDSFVTKNEYPSRAELFRKAIESSSELFI